MRYGFSDFWYGFSDISLYMEATPTIWGDSEASPSVFLSTLLFFLALSLKFNSQFIMKLARLPSLPS